MTWFADYSPCSYFGDQFTDCLMAVGWLERGRPFPTGAVDPNVHAKLVELLKDPWQPAVLMGIHHCDLCIYEGPPSVRNLFVPAGKVVFACPELVAHYMNAHAYRPPDEFCRAVLVCPPMRSMPYLKSLLTAAPALMQATNA